MNKYFFKRYLIKNVYLLIYVILIDILFFIPFAFRKKNNLNDPKNIIICNLGHIGDVVYTLILVNEFKKKFSNANIDFLCGSYSAGLVNKNKLIDDVITIDHWLLNRGDKNIFLKIKKYFLDLFVFFKTNKSKKYDLGVNFFPFYPNPVLLLKLIGTKFIVSFNSSGFNYLNDLSCFWQLKKQHTLSYNNELLSLLDMPQINPKTIKNNFLSGIKNTKYKYKTACIHPCSSSIIKEWDIDNWVEVINFLNKKNYRCLITGNGKREEEYAERLLKMIDDKSKTINYSNRLSLEAFCETINSCVFIITVDTLTIHLANLFKKKSFVIRPGITLDEHWKPIVAGSLIFRYKTVCYPCLKSKGCADMSCIKKVSANDVISSLKKII